MRFDLAVHSYALLVLLVMPVTARAADENQEPAVAQAVQKAQAARIDWPSLRDMNGQPLALADCRWTVVCFLGTECPLAKLYGPRLQRLQEQFAPHQVRFVGVNSNWQDSPAEIRQYADDLQLTLPIIKDVRQVLARELGATRTPEVFVLDSSHRIRYQGRIDDQYEPGVARGEPARHELRDALQALIAGRQVPVARTPAAGCLITRLDRTQVADAPRTANPQTGKTDLGQPPGAVTFTRDVAPILQQHCVECHREGEIGPFALADYDEVVGWAEMILEVVEQNRMPPWHADPRFGLFVGARQLPDEARATLTAWVDSGLPRGDQRDLPPPRDWPRGWHLAETPDVVLAMRERPFDVPAEGTVDYQYFVVDPQWEEDRWVRAAQVVPGDAAVVHHAIVFVRPPDGSRAEGIGWLGGYVPGQRTGPLPAGHARRIPARSKLVFQMHYTPNGRPARDVTQVGVWFCDPDQVTQEVTTRVALNHHFEIPPGARDHEVRLRLDGFGADDRLLGAMPHMHLRGKSFRLDARRGQQQETLLLVPRYDFNWQHWYQFESPLGLRDIDALEMAVHFDNSSGNPFNPAPQDFVTWGDQTWQEMAVAFFDIARPRGQPATAARRTGRGDRPRAAHLSGAADAGDESGAGENSEAAEQQRRRQRVAAEVQRFLARLDRNGDGVVQRDETPETFRRFGFHQFDMNGDERLDRDEIEAAAAQRY